jgi:flagella basal body P-ring formation protein FlgA
MRFYTLFIGCVLAIAAQGLRAENIVIDLHHEALLAHSHVTLSDVAAVETADTALADSFLRLELGVAPLAGHVERLTRNELDVVLRGRALALGRHIEWRGADLVTIRTESRLLDAAELGRVAMAHIREVFGARYDSLELGLAEMPPEVVVPAGTIQLRARSADGARVRPHMPVWIDVLSEGAVYRSVVVALQVEARQRVHVARRFLAGGVATTEDDYALRLEDVAGMADVPVAAGAPAAGRLRQELAEGQILTTKQLISPDMVLHGDRVRLVTATGGIAIEAAAVALADAARGQSVRVRLEKGTDTVVARVIGPGVVSFD